MVVEYTYGLPLLCFLIVGITLSISPITYKMLIRMDNGLSIASLFDSIFVSPKHDTQLG